jgi:hypothetical protein
MAQAVARALSAALVLALLAATAAAFAITEGAKLQRSPIARTDVTKTFSPDAARGGGHRVATIHFKVRTAETLEAWIENGSGDHVRSLLEKRDFKAGRILNLVWDGFTDDGIVAPDGTYKPVVRLDRSHRTIVLPNPIVLDTAPPAITVPKRPHVIISPDGDGHRDSFSVSYKVSEPAHAILRVLPAGAQHADQVEYTRFQRLTGSLVWNGKFDGRSAKPGQYVLYAAAQDTAGNLAKGKPFAVVQVRYIALGRSRVVVRPGGKFALRVSTDAPVLHWTLHGRSGDMRRGTLHFRAPRSKGVFHLYVTAAGHAAQCTVVVA